MKTFIKRNLKLYFRDKVGVFFSLLAVFIILGLYVLFLGDMTVNGIEASTGITGAKILIDTWIISGILSVITVTATLGAFNIMINDKEKKISKDFNSSPIKKSAVTGGYIGSAFLIGIIMSVLALVVSSIYLLFKGAELLSFVEYVKIFLLILLTSLSNTAFVCFIVSFLKSQNAYSTVSSIIGTLIGFLTGIYIPIGSFPEAVQTVIKFFPPSHGAVLFRQILMDRPIKNSFEGIPVEHLNDFKEMMGVKFHFRSYEVTPVLSIIILASTAVLFYILSILNMKKKSKTR